MTRRIKRNAPPSLEVIDRAIELITCGNTLYCCVALSRARVRIETVCDGSARTRLYHTQFRQCIWGPNSDRPIWWNSQHDYYKHERIAALKKFRQACINAAKKERA